MADIIIRCTSCGNEHEELEDLSYQKRSWVGGNLIPASCSHCGVTTGLSIVKKEEE